MQSGFLLLCTNKIYYIFLKLFKIEFLKKMSRGRPKGEKIELMDLMLFEFITPGRSISITSIISNKIGKFTHNFKRVSSSTL